MTRPNLRRALSSPLLISVFVLGSACYGSELSGSAPDVPSSPDADATSPDTGDDATSDTTTSPDGDATTETGEDADTSVPTDTTPDIDTSPPPEWETLSLGDIGAIGDVQAVSKTLAYAVSGTRVLRWNGATWLAYGEPGDSVALHGVWADDNQVVVVGDGGFVSRRVDGGEWATVDVGTSEDLWDADGRADDDLYVVGDKGQVRHWDGTSWSEAFAKTTLDLRSITMDPATGDGLLAVGTGGQAVGQARYLVTTPADPDALVAAQIAGGTVVLSDVAFKSDGTLVAVGSGHTITAKRKTDPSWKGQNSNDERDRDVAALAQTDDGTLYAFGVDGLVLKQVGTSWSVVPEAGVAAGLKDFAAATVLPGDDGAVIVLAGEGSGVRFDGGAWSSIATRPEASVKDLEATTDGTPWAAGSLGLLMTRGADGWSTITLPDAVKAADLEAVALESDGTVWAVGAGGTIIKKATGAAAVRIASPLPLDLFGVTVTDDGVVACGRGGTLITIGGDDVAAVRASGSVADLKAVAWGGDDALWIAGSFGTLLRATGDALPTPVLSGIGGSLNDLTATSDGVLGAGDNGVVLHATEADVELLNETPGAFLQGVAARGDVRFAAGWNGLVLRAEGDAWASEPTGTNLILEAIWVGPDEALAGGRQGVLLRRLEAP